jgi:hypothetical protein
MNSNKKNDKSQASGNLINNIRDGRSTSKSRNNGTGPFITNHHLGTLTTPSTSSGTKANNILYGARSLDKSITNKLLRIGGQSIEKTKEKGPGVIPSSRLVGKSGEPVKVTSHHTALAVLTRQPDLEPQASSPSRNDFQNSRQHPQPSIFEHPNFEEEEDVGFEGLDGVDLNWNKFTKPPDEQSLLEYSAGLLPCYQNLDTVSQRPEIKMMKDVVKFKDFNGTSSLEEVLSSSVKIEEAPIAFGALHGVMEATLTEQPVRVESKFVYGQSSALKFLSKSDRMLQLEAEVIKDNPRAYSVKTFDGKELAPGTFLIGNLLYNPSVTQIQNISTRGTLFLKSTLHCLVNSMHVEISASTPEQSMLLLKEFAIDEFFCTVKSKFHANVYFKCSKDKKGQCPRGCVSTRLFFMGKMVENTKRAKGSFFNDKREAVEVYTGCENAEEIIKEKLMGKVDWVQWLVMEAGDWKVA